MQSFFIMSRHQKKLRTANKLAFMTKYLTILLYFTSCILVTKGQSTPEELGNITFNCFQKLELDRFYIIKPTIRDLAKFGKTMGVDSSSEEYKQFLKRYPSVIENFKEKCSKLLSDSARLHFSWTQSKLDKIESTPQSVSLDDGRTLNIMIIEIHFHSNNRRFKLLLGDVNSYDGIWKPGNNIDLTTQ